MSQNSSPNVAIIQFPGSNCESETARALKHVNLHPIIFRWNRKPDEFDAFDAFVVPGGFSYEDRVRAGVIAAKEPLLDALAEQADKGKPILGICNGAQILLEAGLLPGLKPGYVEMALAANYITYQSKVVRRGHHCGWINLRCEVAPERTPFTCLLKKDDILPMTVSHGEGRFVTNDQTVLDALKQKDLLVWRYCSDEGEISPGLPVNPNGSIMNIAGICNEKGNVMAMMPHPERAFFLRQIPMAWKGPWGERKRAQIRKQIQWKETGPGYGIFASLADYFSLA